MRKTDISLSHELEAEASKIKSGTRLHWYHWFVILCSACITIYASSVTKQQEERRALKIFEEQSQNIVDLVKERMEKYEMALSSAKSAIKANNDRTDYAHWKRYSNDFHISNKYPGINGIGVIYNILPDALPDYLKRERAMRPDYKIHPPHKQREYWPITYIEPEAINMKAVGLDMAHEENRYNALKKARDTGQAQVTAPITLVQDNENTPGFLFYVPFYKGDTSHDTREQRRANVLGAVYAPFIFKKLIAGTLSADARRLKIKISDGDTILYSEISSAENDALYKVQKKVHVYGRVWVFDIVSDAAFDQLNISSKSLYVLLIGGLVEALLISVFLLLVRSNKKAVNFAMRMNEGYKEKALSLQIANDELEEFAYRTSHDLRAPVISSRQLIEMVTAMLDKTKVPERALTSLDMANNSLARLEVLIDEILNLTKIANLQEENVQIAVKDIILESCERASVIDDFLRVNIDVDIPEDVRILNQVRCFQTAADNLISNAVKYQDKTIESSFLHISYSKVEGGHKLVFEDNGIGIPEQHQDKLFTMFKRFHPRTSFGSGLGLYLVKKSILKMGAEIAFHSTDEGSVFTLIFPD
jgi:CHASE1-domain containing sensor protein